MGHFGAIKEENLDPKNHSGAVLSVFRPLFWAQKGLYHIQWECIGPCWTGGDSGGPFGAFGRDYRAPFRDFDSLGPDYCSGALLSLFWPFFEVQKDQNPVQGPRI